MCCDPKGGRGKHGVLGPGAFCCPPKFFLRRFVSCREKHEHLEEYKSHLEKELDGVKERIQELKEE
jgi:hypothetical protein